ncbi:MAG: hypothetical protein GXO28_03865 [Methanopyri archaeon]|nr:hypothetical protein [Methanopyri archaeon]
MHFSRVRLSGSEVEIEARAGGVEVERKFAMLVREGELVLDAEDGDAFRPHDEVKVIVNVEEPVEGAPTERVKALKVREVSYEG